MELPEAFRRMIGTWTGSLVKLNAGGEAVERLTVTIDCAFDSRDGRYFLNQRNHLAGADGSSRTVAVTGPVDDQGRLHLDTEAVEGQVVDLDGSVFAQWTYKNDPEIRCWELTSFLSPDERIRTWHHSRAGKPEGVSVFYERRSRPQ